MYIFKSSECKLIIPFDRSKLLNERVRMKGKHKLHYPLYMYIVNEYQFLAKNEKSASLNVIYQRNLLCQEGGKTNRNSLNVNTCFGSHENYKYYNFLCEQSLILMMTLTVLRFPEVIYRVPPLKSHCLCEK